LRQDREENRRLCAVEANIVSGDGEEAARDGGATVARASLHALILKPPPNAGLVQEFERALKIEVHFGFPLERSELLHLRFFRIGLHFESPLELLLEHLQ
jgi:hypothetical protein